jgi:hypothetical protein
MYKKKCISKFVCIIFFLQIDTWFNVQIEESFPCMMHTQIKDYQQCCTEIIITFSYKFCHSVWLSAASFVCSEIERHTTLHAPICKPIASDNQQRIFLNCSTVTPPGQKSIQKSLEAAISRSSYPHSYDRISAATVEIKRPVSCRQ